MSQAVYFTSGDHEPAEYLHYGLAAPVYTHFTSPIRRYADVVVSKISLSANSRQFSRGESISDSFLTLFDRFTGFLLQ